jgi:hypothetical protein
MPSPSARTRRWILVEIGIVVVGILIAFALNSWWEGRAAGAREQAHLRALHADFTANVERLHALARSQDRVSRASGELLRVARGEGSAEPDSVDHLMGEVFSSDRFDPVMGAYQNLVHSGGLAQIRDDRLRSALASFAATVDSRHAEQFSTTLYLEFNRAFLGRLGWADAVLGEASGLDGAGAGGPEGGGRWNREVVTDPGFQDNPEREGRRRMPQFLCALRAGFAPFAVKKSVSPLRSAAMTTLHTRRPVPCPSWPV